MSILSQAESHLQDLSTLLRGDPPPIPVSGHVLRVMGTVVEAVGVSAMIGQYARMETPDGWRLGEVIGFSGYHATIMPFGGLRGIFPGALVTLVNQDTSVPVGWSLLGRVLDAMGRPLDGKPLLATERCQLKKSAPHPLRRSRIRLPMDVGVRSINALLTVGEGQRVGLFAGSGVGKSVLLGMMARHAFADVVVIALIGERGREVREFIEDILGDGLRHSVVVVATADAPPVLRMRGAEYATAIAEYFRDQGKRVLLIMDSLTRYAMASREAGLAAGELPATKGYPPSTFTALSLLTERAGMGEFGAITAFYSVLVEGDDLQDPVADSVRAILDGHIILRRDLAASGILPAIDPSLSASRVMAKVTTDEHLLAARAFVSLWSKYQERSDLLAIGAYAPGSDPMLDRAIQRYPDMVRFLSQRPDTSCSFAESLHALEEVVGENK
ncbi:MAG: FliI/YscN family ATPase [Acidithiobacillus sp.]|nr:FliI/YscN family ATPase [Acidithiobacillus sp.]